MEQSAPPITDNSKVNQATAHFLAKHNAFQKCIITSLKAENQALYAELSLLQAQRPLLGVEYDWKSAEVVVNNKVAKNLDRIMRDFDREVDKAEDRVEVEREVKKGLADIERERSWIQGFKDTIVQYKARDA